MIEHERDELLRSLSLSKARIYNALTAQGGPMTAPMLREATKRTDGMTNELDHLCKLGLIRPLGKKSLGGRPPALAYVVVLLPDVEKAAKRYAVRGPKRRRRRRGRTTLSQLREMETGSYAKWATGRTRILQLIMLVTQVERMAFWTSAPPDERDLVLDELIELQEATQDAIAAFRMRKEDDAVREKIDKLRTTDGRTEAEAATAHRLADKLQRKL